MKQVKSNHSQSCHILLVEDHEPTRLALEQFLESRDYNVTSATSFRVAHSLMETNQDFQLLISDIGLPDGSGYDLMVEFKKRFGGRGIALTGFEEEENVTQSQASGFTTHLTKPVCAEALDNALNLALKCATDDVFVKDGMPR